MKSIFMILGLAFFSYIADGKTEPEPPKKRRPFAKASANPWAAGFGLHLPEIIRFDLSYRFNRWLTLEGFLAPPIPFTVAVEIPASDIVGKGEFKLAHPDLNIDLKALYGPQWGSSLLWFPTGGSWFIGLGWSVRRIQIRGDEESALLICRTADPRPCAVQEDTIAFRTLFKVEGDVSTWAMILRGQFGWRWSWANQTYFDIQAGWSQPVKVKRNINATVHARNGTGEVGLDPALSSLKSEKEAEMESKTKEALEPFDQRGLPLIGLRLLHRI